MPTAYHYDRNHSSQNASHAARAISGKAVLSAAASAVLLELFTSIPSHSNTEEACSKCNKKQMLCIHCIIAQLKRGYKVAR